MAVMKITVINTLVRALTAIKMAVENDKKSTVATLGLVKVIASETLDEVAEDACWSRACGSSSPARLPVY